MPTLPCTPPSDGAATQRVSHLTCPPASVRVVGRVQGPEPVAVDCDQPLRAVCRTPGCGEVQQWRCDTYGCGPCGKRKQRALERVVGDGAALHLGNGMRGYFLTLTAPGTDEHRRWYQGKRPRFRQDCHCHDHGLSDGLWNAAESKCWNRLRTALTRDRRVFFCGAVETQTRGMLHRHVLVFVDGGLDFQEVQALALAAGYGCVLDLEPVQSASKAARYLAKYVSKSSGARAAISWERLNPDTGEVVGRRATYRLWSSSRSWGVTMRELREVMKAQAAARAMYLREWAAMVAESPAAVAGLAPVTGPEP